MTPQGTLNHWQGQSNHLHPPRSVGETCTSPARLRFRTVAGDDGEGRALLAWEVCTPDWVPIGMFFQPTLIP